MLQTQNLSLIADRTASAKTTDQIIDFWLGFAVRQYPIILVATLLAAAISTIYLLTTPPSYTASATMIIDPRKSQLTQQSVLGDAPSDNAWLDSQIGRLSLEREKIAATVVADLHIADNPELFEANNGIVGNALAFISNLFGNPKTVEVEKPKSKAERLWIATGAVAGGLEVKRVGLTYLITVNSTSNNPTQAVKIANAAADAYVVAQMTANYEAIGQAGDWLQERYRTLGKQAADAEREVMDFKRRNNIVTVAGKTMNDQELTEVNSALTTARAHTSDAKARLSQIESVIHANEESGTVEATVSDALTNSIISKLRQQYIDVSNRETDWSARYGRNHLAVVNLRNQKREIRISILDELKRIAETYRSDYEIAKKTEEDLDKKFKELVAAVPKEAQVTLRGLESSAQNYRTFYDNFFLHYTASVQQQSSPITDTRVIAQATWAPKTQPQTLRVVALAVFGGLSIGVGLGMFREAKDRVFRTSDQVRDTLDSECLAMIPRITDDRRSQRKSSKLQQVDAGRRERVIRGASHTLRAVVESPFSRFTESIRGIKLAADLRGSKGSAKVIGLTSALPREGKSTIASALAQLIAQVGPRVILVDCDLRNPSLSRALAPNADIGIVEVICGHASLDDAIWKDPTTNMAFLPAVSIVQLANTDQILASDSMRLLFQDLRLRYDYVIVDLSPLAPVVDVRATTNLIDSYILLIEWGNTGIDVIKHALQEARGVSDNILGVVLNKVNMSKIGRYQSYLGTYYHHKYLSRYGYTE
jgi:succinoglycan biosynthesis transport protein ExoP